MVPGCDTHVHLDLLDAPVTLAYSVAMETDTSLPVCVNRAPVLTLWAAMVAEHLGYPPETALTLGRFVAGSSACAKVRRLGIADEAREAEGRRVQSAELKPRRQTIRLLGRDVPVLAATDGTLRAHDDGKPGSAESVQTYHRAGVWRPAAGSPGRYGGGGGVAAARGTEPGRFPAL
jgi:hypothetical protein